MKKFMIMLALGLSFSGASFANSPNEKPGPGRDRNNYESAEKVAKRQTEIYDRQYNLSFAQEQKIESFILKQERQKQAWERQGNHSRAAELKFEKEKEKDLERVLKSTLTKKQLSQYRNHYN